MKQINLYQAEFRPPKVILPARLLVFSGVLFLLLLLAWHGWGSWQLQQLQAEVAQAEQRADALSRQLAASLAETRQIDPALAAEAQQLETRVGYLQRAQDAVARGELGSDAGYSAYFRALASTMRPGAWLTSVVISDNGRAMDLQGGVLTGADSAHLIANLRNAPLFVGLSYASLEVGPPPDAASPFTPATREAEQNRQSAARYLVFSLQARLPEPSTAAVRPGLVAAPASMPGSLP